MSDVTKVEKKAEYRYADPWRVIVWPISSGISNMYMMLMMFASYVAAGGYGIAVAVAGMIATSTRILDAVTDPLVAFIADRIDSKYGRVRIMMTIGYSLIVFSVLLMFFWGVGKGVVVFTIAYILYVLGRTIYAVGRDMGTPVMTTEPQQRLNYGRWSVIYTQLFVVAVTSYMSLVLAPKYGGLSMGAFQEMCITCVICGTMLTVLSMVAISPYDKKENFTSEKGKKISVKDCLGLLKGNRTLWAFIVAATSDKLAQQATSQSAITTLLFGVVIGNYAFQGNMNLITLVPSILIVLYATKLRGKGDAKTTFIKWTWIAIGLGVATVAFMVIGDPAKISVSPVYTVIFLVLFCLRSGANVAMSACVNPMIADIVDYEFYRSGNYLPGTVAAIISFIDKAVSSFASTIVAFGIAAVGYVTVMPQPNDPCTPAVFWMTMLLYIGLPIIGWICNLLAMPFYSLTGEKMKEIQIANNEKRDLKNAAQ